MTIEQELTQAQARISELEASVSTVTSERDVARKQAQDNHTLHGVAANERDEFKARSENAEQEKDALTKQAAELTEKNAKLEAKEQDLAKRANVLAVEALAKRGHPAIDLGTDDKPGANAKASNREGLKGLQLAIAAHREKTGAPGSN